MGEKLFLFGIISLSVVIYYVYILKSGGYSEGFQELNPASESGDLKKIDGFSGLFSSPSQIHTVFDPLQNLKGSPQCPDYGMSNDNGFLCLDAATIQLLKTHGGNATGYNATSTQDSQIA
jgi:hypothetical protein